jgi:hypothetical protein
MDNDLPGRDQNGLARIHKEELVPWIAHRILSQVGGHLQPFLFVVGDIHGLPVFFETAGLAECHQSLSFDEIKKPLCQAARLFLPLFPLSLLPLVLPIVVPFASLDIY